MARSIPCDMCHAEDAGAMYSNLSDGSTVAVGENCAPGFVMGLAAAVGLVALPADSVPVEMGGTLAVESANGKAPKRRQRRPESADEASADESGTADETSPDGGDEVPATDIDPMPVPTP